jgi:hypothetical protein
VTVTAGVTIPVNIEVACDAAAGSAEVAVTTTGAVLDPDGYLLTLDDEPAQPIGAQVSVRFGGIAPGSHQLLLSGLASNCAVQGPLESRLHEDRLYQLPRRQCGDLSDEPRRHRRDPPDP